MEAKDTILKKSTFNILNIIDPIIISEYKKNIDAYLNDNLENEKKLLEDLNKKKEELINSKDYQVYQLLRRERNLPLYEIDESNLTTKEEVDKFTKALFYILEDAFCTYGSACLEEKIRNILNTMQHENNYLYQNLENIYQKSCSFAANQEEKAKVLASIYPRELTDYTKEFLDEIDPSKNLSKKFAQMLENKQICIWYPNFWAFPNDVPAIILENFNEEYINHPCCFHKGDKTLINFPRSGQLKDFYYLIHEFFHPLFIPNKEDNVLKETISIIIEKYTRHFLEKKHKYSKDELDYTYANRTIKLKESLKRTKREIELLLQVKNGLPIDSTNYTYFYLKIDYQFYFNLYPYLIGSLIADYFERLEEKRKEKIIANILNYIGSDIIEDNFIEYFFYAIGLCELNYIFVDKPNSLKYLELPDKKNNIY